MPIPYSNLILLVKDLNCPVVDNADYRMRVESEEYKIKNVSSNCEMPNCLPCYKANNTTVPLYRRRPASCISQNKNVSTHFVLILICIV